MTFNLLSPAAFLSFIGLLFSHDSQIYTSLEQNTINTGPDILCLHVRRTVAVQQHRNF